MKYLLAAAARHAARWSGFRVRQRAETAPMLLAVALLLGGSRIAGAHERRARPCRDGL